MANENDNIDPVEGISASRDDSTPVIAESIIANPEESLSRADGIEADERSLDELAAEVVVEDMSAPVENQQAAPAEQAPEPGLEGLDPAVLAAAKDIQNFQLMEYLEMMMTLREAQRQNLLSDYFKKLYENSAQNGPQKTGWAIAGFMEPKHFREVEEAYPEIAQAVTNRVVTRLRDEELMGQLADKAGFTKDEFASLPKDFTAVLAATAEFERDFPPAQGNTLSDRLRESKGTILEGLKSPAAMKALQVASWGFSIATGGVAMKLGVMAVMEGIKTLSANPSVQQFAKDALQTGVKTLSGMGVPMDDVVKGLNLVKENTRSVWSNPKVKFAAAALGAVAVGLVLQEFDFSKVAEAAKPLADNLGELGDTAAKTAGSYVDLVGTVASNSFDIAGHAASTAYDAASSAVGGVVADVATDLAQAGHDLAGDGSTVVTMASPESAVPSAPVASPGFEEAKKAAEQLMTNLGELGDSAANVAGSSVDAAGAVLEETGNATVAAVDNAGATLESAYEGGKQVAGSTMADLGKEMAQAGHDLAGDNLVVSIETPTEQVDIDTQKVVGEHIEGTQAVGVDTQPSPVTHSATPFAPDVSAQPTTVVIEKGDTLSHIAVEQLKAHGIPVTQENITATWQAMYEGNKDVLTKGPHMIFPGQEIKISPDMLPGLSAESVSAPVASPVAAIPDAPAPAFTSAEEEARKILSDAVAAMDSGKDGVVPAALPAAGVTNPGLQHVPASEFLRNIAEKAAKHTADSGPSI